MSSSRFLSICLVLAASVWGEDSHANDFDFAADLVEASGPIAQPLIIVETDRLIRIRNQDLQIGQGFSFADQVRRENCFSAPPAAIDTLSINELGVRLDQEGVNRLRLDPNDDSFLFNAIKQHAGADALNRIDEMPFGLVAVGGTVTISSSMRNPNAEGLITPMQKALTEQNFSSFVEHCGTYYLRDLVRAIKFDVVIRYNKMGSADEGFANELIRLGSSENAVLSDSFQAEMDRRSTRIFVHAFGIDRSDFGDEILPKDITSISKIVRQLVDPEQHHYQGVIVAASFSSWTGYLPFLKMSGISQDSQGFHFISNGDFDIRARQTLAKKQALLSRLDDMRREVEETVDRLGADRVWIEAQDASAGEMQGSELLDLLPAGIVDQYRDDFSSDLGRLDDCHETLQGRSWLDQSFSSLPRDHSCRMLHASKLWPAASRFVAQYSPIKLRIEEPGARPRAITDAYFGSDGYLMVLLPGTLSLPLGSQLLVTGLGPWSGTFDLLFKRQDRFGTYLKLKVRGHGTIDFEDATLQAAPKTP